MKNVIFICLRGLSTLPSCFIRTFSLVAELGFEKVTFFSRKIDLRKISLRCAYITKQANEFQTKGNYDKAIPILKEVPALRREVLGGSNAEVAQSRDLLGELHYLAGKYPDAESLFKGIAFNEDRIIRSQSYCYGRKLRSLYARLAENAKAEFFCSIT
jgi:hypothetical protein